LQISDSHIPVVVHGPVCRLQIYNMVISLLDFFQSY
jgi:hypothetical protein